MHLGFKPMKSDLLVIISFLLPFSLAACRVAPTPSTLPSPTFTALLLSVTPVPTLTITPSRPPTLPASPIVTLQPTPNATVPQSPRAWRIMPLGDSLTSGTYPGRVHSYRGYLEQLLRAAGYSFEFVGTQSKLAHSGTDPNHEGHPGFTIGPDESRFCNMCPTTNLYDHLEDYMQAEPDIVLLLIGVNDLLPLAERPVNPADAPAKLAGLVQRLQALRSQVYIFVASLAPVNYAPVSNLPAYQAINQMAEQLGTADPHDRIYFVSLNRSLESTIDRQTDFADGVHLAEGGARKTAQVWFNALVASELLIQLPP